MMSRRLTIALFAADYVGYQVCRRLLAEGNDVPVVVLPDDEEALFRRETHGLFTGQDTRIVSFSGLHSSEGLREFTGLGVDLAILLWWPTIIRQPLLDVVRRGFLNCHPSLLPYNRGKHYNFWNLVEDVPFGVSLHWVKPGIDDGAIAFQKPLAKNWEDTGETLYLRAREAIIDLVLESFGRIQVGDIPAIEQDLARGSFHYAKELEPASHIHLDRTYTGRQLINLLRARTFYPHPGCWFSEDGERYEIRINIKKVMKFKTRS